MLLTKCIYSLIYGWSIDSHRIRFCNSLGPDDAYICQWNHRTCITKVCLQLIFSTSCSHPLRPNELGNCCLLPSKSHCMWSHPVRSSTYSSVACYKVLSWHHSYQGNCPPKWSLVCLPEDWVMSWCICFCYIYLKPLEVSEIRYPHWISCDSVSVKSLQQCQMSNKTP